MGMALKQGRAFTPAGIRTCSLLLASFSHLSTSDMVMGLKQGRAFTLVGIGTCSLLLAGISHLLHQRHGDGLEAGEVLHQWLQGDAWHELDEEVKELGGEEERGMGHVAT